VAVGHAVIATAAELFEARHYPSVVALVSDALEEMPESVELLMMRARAHIALRRDLESQADLRDIIRLDPQCGLAYRLLGELAARRDENESAAIFFREALRLDPDDVEADDWLSIVQISSRPAAVVEIPAPAAAAGRFPSLAPRFASGTMSPDQPGDDDDTEETGQHRAARPAAIVAALPPRLASGSSPELAPYRSPEPPTLRREPALPPRASTRGITPELPGFGDYLVATGILTRERLRAAQAYQRSMKVQLSTAIVTLGLATPQRIEWAAVAHQSHLARGGH
jgi:tetratricopeptide (TPR) repeat protein